jgi:hypothetical protein
MGHRRGTTDPERWTLIRLGIAGVRLRMLAG